MRQLRQPVGLLACFCLLTVQWSGIHRHADENGRIGAPEIAASHTHFHQHDHAAEHDGLAHARAATMLADGAGAASLHSHEHEHEHEDEREVSALELAPGSAKLPVFIVTAFIPHAVPAIAGVPLDAIRAEPALRDRHLRWRPPLRGPPLAA